MEKLNKIEIKAFPELIVSIEESPEKIRKENIKKESHFLKTWHDTAVVGNLLKDYSWPTNNIIVKLPVITFLVFGIYIKGNYICGPRNWHAKIRNR